MRRIFSEELLFLPLYSEKNISLKSTILLSRTYCCCHQLLPLSPEVQTTPKNEHGTVFLKVYNNYTVVFKKVLMGIFFSCLFYV